MAHGKKHSIGHEVVPKHRFTSQNTTEYKPKNFRRFSKLFNLIPILLPFMILCIVDKPLMKPRKDYDDYTKFINDTFAGEKEGMLRGTVDHMNKTGGFG